MTSGDAAFDAYVSAAAGLCDEMAALLTDGGLPPFAADPADGAVWSQDREQLRDALGTDEPMAWTVRTVPTYLGEGAYELRAVAALLRARILTGSIGPLVRSITERVGMTAWMLDPEADAMERAWRVILNALVCWSEYRRAVERLGAGEDEIEELEHEHRRLRAAAQSWFAPTVGQKDPGWERAWRRGTSGYPTYTDLAVRSLPSIGPDDPLRDVQRRGLYSAQCGMTHPNVIVSGETVDVNDIGQMRFLHRWDHIDKEIRVGFHSLSWGYRAWAWYFCKPGDSDEVVHTVSSLSERLDTLTDFDD